MGDPERIATTNDADDPYNYISFDDFVAGSAKIWSLENLTSRWNAAHPEALVSTGVGPVVPPGTLSSGVVIEEASGLVRVFAAVQLLGGGLELIVGGGALLAPEPTGATKVVGVVVLIHGMDTIQSSFRTIVTGERTVTYTQQGATFAAREAGASVPAAETIGVVTDIGIGVGGSFGIGMLSKAAPGAASGLVHLTNADSAAAIRGSETLGLGRGTIYAGPETLSKARGWSILARTGRPASQMTEAILLPSQANRSFLVVQPIGPMSLWQRLGGTVFSAGAGTFNLQTGAFTRTGLAINQIGVYSIDAAVMTSVKAGAEICDPYNP
ncbi:hypothetical protein JQ615_41165 [Bradyrhizobium jicamae]|uniref:Uncharacterized protein n=1 Tax=Bradyrhizobium jicamae TaxID=280332 RepID=A0ABS5FY40_9BRAD|nr:hypothetical protein [Bradyrhizobium jicamae]MBR0801754.1 hypothetical protein [Bradyrhizobium jicamae]